MKKIIYFIIMFFSLGLLSGCEESETKMENINIYTTTYPINFIINQLYEEHSKIYSVYPTGVDVDKYELSTRKLEEYSKSDLFIFNSLDKDRDYAVKMINLNSKLKVIDVATGMKYDNSIEELWLSPNNYLMMAENLKNGLAEYITNPYLVEEINDKYKDLEYEISKLDADLTEAITSAKYKTIVTDNDTLKFLEKYGLKVISLEENKDLTTNKIEEVKNLIKEKQIKYIYSTTSKTNNTVKELIDNNNLEQISMNTMHSTDGNITNSNDNYLTIMTNNINELKKELYK
ncbi:MAG: metal ABC transporter substrate-binding protein [Bacilli bacterium]|nr:metal ABC transporter substrate-binding protein [Bacilli bacterium]